MIAKNANCLHRVSRRPPATFSQAVADNVVRESLFRLLNVNQFEDVLAVLEKHPSLIFAVDENGADAARYAVLANDAGVLHRLAFRGADLDNQDKDGWSHMMEAAHNGFTGILQVLISHGADINKKTPLGWTPVQLALLHGHSEAAYVLIKAGANLHDGPMKGMHATDIIDCAALDPKVVNLVREGALAANQGEPLAAPAFV
ncbi:MAG: ankyrin repeat domain-containing protein [Sulfuricaulis sp.]